MKYEAIQPNMMIIHDDMSSSLISYNKCIAKKDNSTLFPLIVLDSIFWNYSKTTGKHRNIFLGETMKITQAKIDNGIYKLANLNK